MRGTDLSRIPEEIISLYDDDTAADGELIYTPKSLSVEKAQAS